MPHRSQSLDRRRGRRTGVALTIASLVGCSLLAAAPAVSARPKPPNPSDQQISAARAKKAALATEVGTIAGRLAAAQAQLDRLTNDAQVAEQKLAFALQRQRQANDAAAAAKAAVQRAQSKVENAHTRFVQYLQAAYMGGSDAGALGSLLTATDPNALLDQGTLQQYVADNKLDAIGTLTTATVGKSNADASARAAVQRQARATTTAKVAQQNVLAALSQAKVQKGVLDKQMATDRHRLQLAQMKLTGLTNQRAAYLAWKKQQEEIAAREAARKRAQQLAQQRAAAAYVPTPAGGSWTAAKGRQAVSRVMGFLGMPYSWAAGNSSGPTFGVSEPGSAWNDSNIRGFDCSGLTIYAWAPWISMDHLASTQYTQVGSSHPSINQLMPGDLVFWSGDGSIGGIGHVAIYVGNGNVIQAPQSGDVIKISNIYNVENGYFGATRPLT
jgi:cell wall-associated NlpC family hydrolase